MTFTFNSYSFRDNLSWKGVFDVLKKKQFKKYLYHIQCFLNYLEINKRTLRLHTQ